MRPILLLPLIAATAAALHAQESTASLRRETSVWESVRTRNLTRFAAFLDSSYRSVGGSGINTRASEIASVGQVNLRSFRITDLETARPDPRTEIMTYSVVLDGDMQGQSFAGTYFASSTWRRYGDDWRVVLHSAVRRDDAGAAVQQAATPASRAAEVRAALARTNADLERWYAAGQIDSVAAIYAPDAWQAGPNMAPVVGRDSIAAAWRRAVGTGTWRFTLRTQDMDVQGPLAVERGTYELRFERAASAPAEAPPSFTDRGNYLVTWVQRDGRWLIKWDHATSSMPR